MGFGTIVGQVILFGLLIVLYSNLIRSIDDHSDLMHETLDASQAERMKIIGTNILIYSVETVNSSSPCRTTILANNTGKIPIEISKMTLYLDGIRNTDITTSIIASTEAKNSLLFDPGETLRIRFNKDLDKDTHIFSVAAENGISFEKTYEVTVDCN